jgi:beta-lactamase superfamily II metal-dependent hydrolase
MHLPRRAPALHSVACIVLLVSCILAAGCTTGSFGIPAGPLHRAENTGDLYVYFLDAGQGDASVILFHDTVILIDAGDTDQGDRVVRYLRTLGADHIDLLVATHPHSDHIGGMQAVIGAMPVRQVLDAGTPHTSSVYEQFLAVIDERHIPYVVADRGMTIGTDPALRILVLSPPEERLDADLNANSIVLKVSHGTTSFLFTGDAGTAAEDALLMSGYSLEAQVLKVAHHGSADATSVSFLSRVRPEVAVISLSDDNPYGYPHRETLDALQAVPAVYRTDRDGTILIRSNGTSYSVATENGPGGIWMTSPSPSISPGPVTPASCEPPAPSVSASVTFPTLPPLPANVTIPSVVVPSLQIGNASSVSIDAVQFNAPGDDRENLNGEWVRILNNGSGPVLIAGWTLSDSTGADPYTFPAVLLLPRTSVTVCTGSGSMNDTTLFMGRTEPLWGNSGDTAFLRDGSGAIIDRRSAGGPQ